MSSLGSLGFYRGMNEYDYSYHRKNMYKQNTSYLYTNKIIYGLFGASLYVFPVAYIILLQKELYRLEVNIRNLEDEKTTDYYNLLLF